MKKDKIVQISVTATHPNVAENIYGLGASGTVYVYEYDLASWKKQTWTPILNNPELLKVESLKT